MYEIEPSKTNEEFILVVVVYDGKRAEAKIPRIVGKEQMKKLIDSFWDTVGCEPTREAVSD